MAGSGATPDRRADAPGQVTIGSWSLCCPPELLSDRGRAERPRGCGVPPVGTTAQVRGRYGQRSESIVFRLRTGCPWRTLPERFRSRRAPHQFGKDGTWDPILAAQRSLEVRMRDAASCSDMHRFVIPVPRILGGRQRSPVRGQGRRHVADYIYNTFPAHERDDLPTARQLTTSPPAPYRHRTTQTPRLPIASPVPQHAVDVPLVGRGDSPAHKGAG